MIYLEQHFVQNVDREMSINSFEEPFYLVEVLAFFLKYLKQCLMGKFELDVPQERIVVADIHWVIIVPVELKQLIREAASLVSKFSCSKVPKFLFSLIVASTMVILIRITI